MDFNRRRILGSLAATCLPLAAPFDGYGQEAPEKPAQTPASAESAQLPSDGFRVLEAKKLSLPLLPAPAVHTQGAGFDATVPGPVLRYKKGEEVKIRLSNKLDQAASIHWSGVRLVNSMDGAAPLTQAAVMPGASFDYRFTPPDSGFFWYHPDARSFSALNQGLYGGLIVEEAVPIKVDADALIVLDDWQLDDKGQIAPAAPSETQKTPAPLTTLNSNGAAVEATLPPGSRLRLRLLSAALENLIVVSFIGIKPLVIGIDGQPCEPFEPVRRSLPLHPGARFDIVFDLPAEDPTESTLLLRGNGMPDRPLFTWKTKGDKRPDAGPLPVLPANPLLPTEIHLEKSSKIDLLIEGGPTLNTPAKQLALAQTPSIKPWKINGLASNSLAAKPLFSVKRGTPVTLAFINKTAVFQSFHLHGHVFRLLHDLDDGWEPYWRDSFLIPENHTKHIAFIADNPGKWVIESTMPLRAGAGLATWFKVT
jgi:FtsP/CotA-like multicopper oxidase with cupredoxin domain